MQKNQSMRYYLLLILSGLLFAGCQQADKGATAVKSPYAGEAKAQSANAHLTEIEWKQKTINYGKIKEGDNLDIAFQFKNTGDFPLLISRVEPSCGCTVADFPKEPVAPGKEGIIKGTFNSTGKSHAQHKTLLVYANSAAAQPAELSFDVEVEPKK